MWKTLCSTLVRAERADRGQLGRLATATSSRRYSANATARLSRLGSIAAVASLSRPEHRFSGLTASRRLAHGQPDQASAAASSKVRRHFQSLLLCFQFSEIASGMCNFFDYLSKPAIDLNP